MCLIVPRVSRLVYYLKVGEAEAGSGVRQLESGESGMSRHNAVNTCYIVHCPTYIFRGPCLYMPNNDTNNPLLLPPRATSLLNIHTTSIEEYLSIQQSSILSFYMFLFVCIILRIAPECVFSLVTWWDSSLRVEA